MFKRVGAAILLIENMEKSVTFYRDILGKKIKLRVSRLDQVCKSKRKSSTALHPKRTKSSGPPNMLVGFISMT